MMDSSRLRITVAYCAPEVEDVTPVRVAKGATVRDAIAASQIYTRHPELKELPDTGIWGRRCSLDEVLAEGDRVEIYRSLIIDPKEGRRMRAEIRRKRSRAS
jgi:putative ubiquitin-RnfH superfamily antitoxin RatB of RatAB toxin-antitoxin module